MFGTTIIWLNSFPNLITSLASMVRHFIYFPKDVSKLVSFEFVQNFVQSEIKGIRGLTSIGSSEMKYIDSLVSISTYRDYVNCLSRVVHLLNLIAIKLNYFLQQYLFKNCLSRHRNHSSEFLLPCRFQISHHWTIGVQFYQSTGKRYHLTCRVNEFCTTLLVKSSPCSLACSKIFTWMFEEFLKPLHKNEFQFF